MPHAGTWHLARWRLHPLSLPGMLNYLYIKAMCKKDEVFMGKCYLKEERLRLGLKSKDVAKHAGVAIPTQSNYELGKRHPDAQYLIKIAEIGFEIDYVITGRRNNMSLSPRELRLLMYFREAPEPVQDFILKGLQPIDNE